MISPNRLSSIHIAALCGFLGLAGVGAFGYCAFDLCPLLSTGGDATQAAPLPDWLFIGLGIGSALLFIASGALVHQHRRTQLSTRVLTKALRRISEDQSATLREDPARLLPHHATDDAALAELAEATRHLLSTCHSLHSHYEQSSNLLAALRRSRHDILWTMDERLIFTSVDQAAEQIPGFSASLLQGTSVLDHLSQTSRATVQARLTERLRAPSLSPRRSDSDRLLLEFVAPSGERSWLDVTSSPCFTSDGTFQGFCGVARAVGTARAALESIPAAVVRQDASGRFTMANHAFCHWIGLPCAEVMGRLPEEVLPDWFVEGLAELDAGFKPETHQRCTSLQGAVTASPGTLADGQTGPAHARQSHIVLCRTREDNGCTTTLCMDMTSCDTWYQRLRAEQAACQRENQRKSQYIAHSIAMVSHELRTPLAAMLGQLDLMLDSAPNNSPDNAPNSAQNDVQALRETAHHMLAVLNTFMDQAASQHNTFVPNLSDFDLHRELCDAVESMRNRAAAKHLDLTIDTPNPDLPRIVTGDVVRLRQVLYNLLSNAISYTDAGFVHVQAEPAESADIPHGVRILVQDSGRGIPANRHASIFHPFDRGAEHEPLLGPGQTTPTARTGGSGLGLAIVQRIVTGLGGAITLESAPGVGSTFTFTLPLPRAASSCPARERADASIQQYAQSLTPRSERPGPRPSTRPCTILLVDDCELNGRVVTRLLSACGHRITWVRSGQQALETLRLSRTAFDLALVDLEMPGMSGVQTAEQMQALYGEHPPIAALTAHCIEDAIARMGQQGLEGTPFRTLFTKPLNLGAFEEFLGTLPFGTPSPQPESSQPESSQVAPLHTAEPMASYGTTSKPDKAHNRMPRTDRVLDREWALRRAEGDTTFVAQMERLFFMELDERRRGLQHAVHVENSPAVERLAHSLKGVSAVVGAGQVHFLASALERAARNAHTRSADQEDHSNPLAEPHARLDAALQAVRDMRDPSLLPESSDLPESPESPDSVESPDSGQSVDKG